jgi:DNA-binding transcriptional ArsR family regulator
MRRSGAASSSAAPTPSCSPGADRLVIALEQSIFLKTDRTTYAAEAAIAAPTASGDLRRLLDAGLIAREGIGRTTHYRASDQLRDDLRAHLADLAQDAG